ncbi:chorismate mutase [Streptomyces capparidis]
MSSRRRPLTALLTAAAAVALAAVPAAAVPARPGAIRPTADLLPLVDASARRLLAADQVAAAKWRTGSPIDDPARERALLDDVARQARALGADPEATVRIFRDQIEASKVVQRGLHRQWTADPSRAPAGPPAASDGLDAVRQRLDLLDSELVRAVAEAERARRSPGCRGVLAADVARVGRARQLDALHTAALARALPSVCEQVRAQPASATDQVTP